MGNSKSRRKIKQKGNLENGACLQDVSCECVSFLLQPHCTSFRHMHAFMDDGTHELVIEDLTLDKEFRIKNVTKCKSKLMKEEFLPPNLAQCNVIGYQWNLAVIQVFFRDHVAVFVCDCTNLKCIYKYTVCPCVRRRTGLCEAYFTSNRQYLIVKSSDAYCVQVANRNYDHSFYEVSKLDSEIIISSHISFSDEDEMVFLGLCPDPDSATGIYTAVYRDSRIYNENRMGRFYPGLGIIDVTEKFHQDPGRPGTNDSSSFARLHTRYDHYWYRSDKSRIIYLQIPRDNKYIYMTFVELNNFHVTVHLLEKDDLTKIVRVWEYDSLKRSWPSLPILSPNGTHINIAGETLPISKGNLKTLSCLCVDLLVDTIHPEDIGKLDLPNKLKYVLLYGYISSHGFENSEEGRPNS